MTLNSFFEKIYCINLDRREDRWTDCEKEFTKHGLLVERISATDWKDVFPDTEYTARYRGNIANLTSYIRTLEKAQSDKAASFLVLEDDVVFDDNLTESFFDYVQHLPEDWNTLYLGANLNGGFARTSSPNLLIPVGALTSHAIGFNSPAAEVILPILKNHLSQIYSMPTNTQYAQFVGVDVWLAQIQKDLPAYCVNPCLALQRIDYSDIEQAPANYDHVLKYSY